MYICINIINQYIVELLYCCINFVILFIVSLPACIHGL